MNQPPNPSQRSACWHPARWHPRSSHAAKRSLEAGASVSQENVEPCSAKAPSHFELVDPTGRRHSADSQPRPGPTLWPAGDVMRCDWRLRRRLSLEYGRQGTEGWSFVVSTAARQPRWPDVKVKVLVDSHRGMEHPPRFAVRNGKDLPRFALLIWAWLRLVKRQAWALGM